jgi:hypothetical protein
MAVEVVEVADTLLSILARRGRTTRSWRSGRLHTEEELTDERLGRTTSKAVPWPRAEIDRGIVRVVEGRCPPRHRTHRAPAHTPCVTFP